MDNCRRYFLIVKDAVKKVGFSREKLSLVTGKEKSNENDHKKDNNINTKCFL